ncbi:MAG: prepilin peptidase [Spirochaetes bacterium]|nr:prepilin peptidase [Spirochaetota bacterium]
MERLFLTGKWIDLSILLSFLCPITIIDIKERTVPDELTFMGLIIFFTKAVFHNTVPVLILPVRSMVGFMFVFMLFLLKKGGIGLGDAKLCALLSLVLGFDGFMIVLFTASCTGIAYMLLMLGLKRKPLNRSIPFAPFLSIGGITAYIMQDTFRNLLDRIPFW